MITPEEDDQLSRRYSLTGNSTTQSENEIEKFYRELELEMFGEEELPSMVGQTLEVPLNGDKSCSREDNKFISDETSVNSGMTEKFSTNGLDDELLEKEQNRSMISQCLLEDAYNELSKVDHSSNDPKEQDGNHYYYSSQPTQPLNRDQKTQQTGLNSMSSSNFQGRSNFNGSSKVMEYQEPYTSKKQTIPLHAGMTMFENCALLGGQNNTSFRRERTRRCSRRNDMNAGPKVQFVPPPTHLTPYHWLDDSDAGIISSGEHDTITISEDNFDDRTRIGRQHYTPYSNNVQ
jgi:hypothetical protein